MTKFNVIHYTNLTQPVALPAELCPQISLNYFASLREAGPAHDITEPTEELRFYSILLTLAAVIGFEPMRELNSGRVKASCPQPLGDTAIYFYKTLSGITI